MRIKIVALAALLFSCLVLASAGFAQQRIPSDPLGFNRWLVVSRAEMALKGSNWAQTGPERILPIQGMHGMMDNGHVIMILAGAYTGPWSPLYQSPEVAQKAGRLLDAFADLYLDPDYAHRIAERSANNGGYDKDEQFTLHSFSLAVFLWQEAGAFPKERIERWIKTVRVMAELALTENNTFLAGRYANPEFYGLSGLAVAAKLTGEDRYRQEARRWFERYPEAFYPGGGVAYFFDSNPEMGYQSMVVFGTAIYYDMTHDPAALAALKGMVNYYQESIHPLGFQPPYEAPSLKQHWIQPFFPPSSVRFLAVRTGDEHLSALADAVEARYREGLEGKWPSFMAERGQGGRAYNVNYHHAKMALWSLRDWRDIKSEPVPVRRVEADTSHRGGRVVWDNFAGFFTSRPFSDTRAGCMVLDPAEPFVPLHAALAMAYPESAQTRSGGRQSWFFTNERWPHQQLTGGPGIQVMTQANRLTAFYWDQYPAQYEARDGGQVQESDSGGWRTVETWAVLPNLLAGLVDMRATQDGGVAEADWARVRFVFYPNNRELATVTTEEDGQSIMSGSYGKLGFKLIRLAGDDWKFAVLEGGNRLPIQPVDNTAPNPVQGKQPALVKQTVPWKISDSATLACAWSPTDSGMLDKVAARQVNASIAALAVPLSSKEAYLVVANHSLRATRVWLRPDKGWTATLHRDCGICTPSPFDEIARLGLSGESHIVYHLTSAAALPNATELLARLSVPEVRRP
jgi:hypothetical protein